MINNYGPAPQTPAVQAAPQSVPVGAETSLSSQAWLGVRIQQVTDDIADSLNIKPAKGALVEGVDDKGPAKPAGIEPGDVIVKFDGKDVKEMKDLPAMVATMPVGKDVEVVIIRKGQEAKKTVKLGRLVDAPSNQDGRPAK